MTRVLRQLAHVALLLGLAAGAIDITIAVAVGLHTCTARHLPQCPREIAR